MGQKLTGFRPHLHPSLACVAELLQKNGECRCPACPPADEAVRSSLTALHNKFEKTSDKLIKASESIDKKVSTYGRKFEAIAAKVQKFIPMAGLGF